MSKAKQAKSAAIEATAFVKRVPFEPEPGQLGMNREQMIEAGWIKEGEGTVTGALFALMDLMKTLKERRASLGLSLTDVSERSGLTRQAISKLENGHTINPTLETLFRYSMALDALVTLGVEDMEPEE
jgi:DNA-binding XRE family transcriptional regulator